MKKKKSVIELFFIGDSFYHESSTLMSPIYTVEKKRFDWGLVNVALRNGSTVLIRPATEEEMAWAKEELTKLKRKFGTGPTKTIATI